MDLVDKYLGEMMDSRGKVKVGSVTLNANIDFQRMILNQHEPNISSTDPKTGVTYYGGSGMKNPLTVKEIEKIYKESKEFWKKGGKYTNVGSKKVFISMNIIIHDPRESKPYYGSWNYDGYVGSSKGTKTPKEAFKEAVESLWWSIKKHNLEVN
jgi:hypothetical protein